MPTPPYPLQPKPMERRWLERNPRWKIPLGCLTGIVLLGGFVVVLFAVIMATFRSSDVYKQAIARAESDPQVRELIGEPMRQQGLITGQLNVSGNEGSADMSIPIAGPRGKGFIGFVAAKNSGVWRFSRLQVNVTGQASPIDLLSVQPPATREF
jgi:hypothetical protein